MSRKQSHSAAEVSESVAVVSLEQLFAITRAPATLLGLPQPRVASLCIATAAAAAIAHCLGCSGRGRRALEGRGGRSDRWQ